MDQHPRYEVLGLIGNGDFAAVYRARDRELGRDVAIKQIHGQYMNDPARLARFWREAQLLATLSHPHIMTIYDIVRPRGWLVVELMHGTLLDASKGQPIDLSQLRSALVGSLQALSMLHANQVIHGDIKPSNLLLDRMGRVKLGDFGLARRVANDQGSYVKGATRYMAPELAAPQFGAVGPPADLYSLGITAYELLCGPKQFEELFPGLDVFGRDRQVAWMMWHADPDRQLPPVASVLDGVPADLARVIDRLTTKDQSKRYRTADQALADLGDQTGVAAQPQADDEEAAKANRKKFQRRMVAVLALVASLLMSVIVAVMPTEKKTVASSPDPVSVRGVVRMLIPDRQTMIVEQAAGRGPKEIVVRTSDRVYLNDKASLLRELRENDQVAIETLRDEQGRALLEIHASRPEEDRGTIASLRAEDGELSVALAGADEELKLTAGPQTTVEINGAVTNDGKPYTLADLKRGDRVNVLHFQDQDRETVLKIAAVRVVPGEGVIRAINLPKREVSIAVGPEEGASVTVWPLDEKVEVSLNGRRLLENRLLTATDLKVGDRVKFDRDLKIVSIAAQRRFTSSGTISAIRYDVKAFTGSVNGAERTFVLSPQCAISLAGNQVSFDDLRRGDTFDVQFDEPDAASPAVVGVTAERPADRGKWAVIITSASFDDSSLPSLSKVESAGANLQHSLSGRYAVPADQIVIFPNPSRVRLEQGLSDALGKASQARQLLVFLGARVFTGGKAPLVAPRDFDGMRADVTGVPLASLLAEIDKSPIAEKLVVFDMATASAAQSDSVTSAATVVDSIRGTRSRPLLKTTTVLASDEKATDASAGRLLATIAIGLAGAADADRDNHVTAAELNDYAKSSSSSGGIVRLLLPDATPPRLTDDAKSALRRLATAASKTKIEKAEAAALTAAADQLAPKQPEPKLLGAILMLKAKEQNDSVAWLEQVVAVHPRTPLAWALLAWARFEKYNYAGGIADLTQLVNNLPEGNLADMSRRTIILAGQLREFAATESATDRRPGAAAIAELDRAIAARPKDVATAFEQGRTHVTNVSKEFQKKVEMAPNEQAKLQIRLDRQQLRNYSAFSLETAAQQVISSLDAE